MAKRIYARREIHLRVVYAGPGFGGKTTSVVEIGRLLGIEPEQVATEGDRTWLLDHLGIRRPGPRDWRLVLNLQTVPGQVKFRNGRAMVLRNADAVIFVADSAPERMEANRFALDDLRVLLEEQGKDPTTIPLVFQYNKRDLPDALPIRELEAVLNPTGAPAVATIASRPLGICRILGEAIALAERKLTAELVLESEVSGGGPVSLTRGGAI